MPRTKHKKSKNVLDDLIQVANDLNLTVLAKEILDKLQNAEEEKPSFSEFALQLLTAEANARKERRLKRLLKFSKLGKVNGLEGFDLRL